MKVTLVPSANQGLSKCVNKKNMQIHGLCTWKVLGLVKACRRYQSDSDYPKYGDWCKLCFKKLNFNTKIYYQVLVSKDYLFLLSCKEAVIYTMGKCPKINFYYKRDCGKVFVHRLKIPHYRIAQFLGNPNVVLEAENLKC